MAVVVRVYGAKRVRQNFKALNSDLKTIDNQPFAARLLEEAYKNLNSTRKNWPNPDTPGHITFGTKVKKLPSGMTVMLTGTSEGKDGTDYLLIQDQGYPRMRYAKPGLDRFGNRNKMRFMGQNGSWISKTSVKPIPAKGFIMQTGLWASDNYPPYVERKVAEAVARNMKPTGR